MSDVFTTQKYNVAVVSYAAKLALGEDVSGAGGGGYGTKIIVLNDAQDELAQTILDAMESLLVVTDEETIVADDVAVAVISMVTADAALDWLLVLDGIIMGFGTEAAVAGSVTLEFSIDTPGSYEIWFVRRTGNYATGFVSVEAT